MIHKIVCVEDSPIMQNIYKRVFDGCGFAKHVVALRNGQEALDYYNSLLDSSGTGDQESDNEYPDLMFLDLNMPVMGGWEFLDEFKKLQLNDSLEPGIVILTSSVDPRDKERAKQYSGIIDFLSKPLTFEMLDDLRDKWNKSR